MAEGEGDKTGDNKGGDNKTLTPEEVAGLKSSIETLSGGVKEIMSLAQKRAEEQAARERAAAAHDKTKDDDEDGVDDTVLETMPRRQFGEYLLKSFAKHLDTALKPIKDGVTQAATAAQTVDVKVQVQQFAEKHADFNDWKDEMLALAKDNPTLTVQRLYTLARSENPDKAKELDKKIADAKKASEEGDATSTTTRKPPAKRAVKGNGLSPSGATGEAKPGKMNPQQAAEAAWADAVAQFGGNPFES
jgi:hypothetical protein